MKKSLPNIIWYCTDQQRSDTINGLGNQYINTPNINKFMKNGFTFKNAYVQSPICTPSRASFLTGRYPASTHAHRNGAEYFPDHEVLITKILKENLVTYFKKYLTVTYENKKDNIIAINNK